MEQKALAKWLKLILIGVGICGLIIYAIVFPSCGQALIEEYPEFKGRFWPWMVFIWASGVPCYAVLALGWRIASKIGEDRSFSEENANSLKWISWYAAGDAVFFFAGNILLLFLDMSHPGAVLLSFLVVFAGVAVAVAAAALSHLVQKAAVLQEQSDLTI